MEPVKETKFDNKGNIRVTNRQARRHKEPTDNWYTKATHKIKKIRNKNARKEKRQRERAIVETRKARKAGNTQVS